MQNFGLDWLVLKECISLISTESNIYLHILENRREYFECERLHSRQVDKKIIFIRLNI